MPEFNYSVIIPVYNSASTLEVLFGRIKQVFSELNLSFRVIFIDDCSKDGSLKKLIELKKAYPEEIQVISLSKNAGQHLAILSGLHLAADGNVIVIDDDLQIPPEEISKLIEVHSNTNADVIYGIFKKKRHNFIRNAGSKFFEALFKYFATTPGKGSAFKLIDRNITQKITHIHSRYFYLDEVISWFTDDIVFTDVTHEKRKAGKSNYSFFKLLFMSLSFIISYTILPLRIMTYTGLIASLVSLGFVIYFIVQKYTIGAELGFTALISAIFLSTSIILFCMGIIGEYISRLYANQNKRPPYIIKKVY